MAFSAHASNCVKSVVRLSDDEVSEILSLSDALQEQDSTLTADTAVIAAVQQLIAEMKGERALPTTPFSGLSGEDPRKAITDRIATEGRTGFETKVNAAVAAGDISRNQGDTLIEMGAQDARGMAKAKDELIRYRERAAERKTAEREAGKSWEDPDFNYMEGDPKWSDLSPEARRQWTEAVSQHKANGDLYERLVAENKVVAAMPQVDTEGDISTQRDASGAIENPDRGKAKLVESTSRAMQMAHTAAEWLAKNGSTPFIRSVAARILPILDRNVPITWVRNGSYAGVPIGAQNYLKANSFALFVGSPDGSGAMYFRDPERTTEVDVLHELLHAATQRGFIVSDNPKLNQDMQVLSKVLARSFRDIHYTTDDANTSDDATYFQTVLNSPDELIAYGFSSPALRRMMERFNYDGTERGLKEEYADALTRRRAEQLFEPDQNQPTLWQRFVDFVLSALGLDKIYAPKIKAMLEDNEAKKQAYLAGNLTPTLIQAMDNYFDAALAQQKATPPSRVAEARAAGTASRMTEAVNASTASVPGQKGSQATNVLAGGIPDFEPGNRFATTLKDWSGGWRNKPGMLGWLTLRQLADRFKDVPGVQEFTDLSARMGAKAKALMSEAHRIDQPWALLKTDDANAMQKLMLESTMDQIWPNRPFESQTHLDQTSPALKAKHANLSKRYNELSEPAKRTYEQVQAKMRKDWQERGDLLKKRIIDQYRAELHRVFPGEKLDAAATVKKADRASVMQPLSKSEKKSMASLYSDLDTHAERLAQMQGPYFPLMRFGQHVVVAKSNDLNQAADRFASARERLDGLNADDESTEEQLKKARDEVKSAQAAVEGFKEQEKHYIVEFYESPSEARARAAQLNSHFAAQGTPMAVYTERREEHFGRIDSVPPSFMKKLEDSLSANLPDKDANAIRAAVRDLYIQSMPERSALKSQLRRIGVKGVKESEMRRSFAAAAMRSSWHLSRLEFGDEMNQHLVSLRTGDTDDQRIVGGELTRRMAATFQQDTSNLLVDRLSNLSYLTYLGMSPSFFVINAMQPWTISLPVMAARYGMRRSTAELGRAFTEVAAAMKNSAIDQGTWRFELNLEEFKDPGERKMLEELFNAGIIDVTIEHDLGSLAGGQETGAFGKVMSLATLPAHHTEVVNRVMTALAAYRLASAGGLGERLTSAQATKYAEQVVAETHLDYTPENAPRFMRSASLGGLGRIVFQFKKYMQGMIFLMGKQVADAARGDKEQAKAFAYLLGMQVATAGMAGLPFAAPVGLLVSAVGLMYPEDDRKEWSLLIYKGMKDAIGETAARALMKGIPAAIGVDISSRVGFGNILNPLAFVPPGKEGADYVAAATMSLAGPAVSMMANWAQALTVAKDDPVKATTMALPKFLADPLRAIDRSNRGVTNKRGDTLIPAEEFGPLGLMMRALGFEKSDVTDMYDTRSAFMDAKKARDDARARLIRQAVDARMHDGDTAEVQDKIDAFNERHPDDRIKGSTVASAVKAKVITAKELKEGVRIRKNDRALAESLGIGQ